MPLTDEIRQAAENLGKALANSPEMEELETLQAGSPEAGRIDLQFEVVKALFTRTAMRLNTTLGVKFTDFVE
jgi:hypothetical protein